MTTEVAGNPLVGHTVLSARRYESGPPANATLDVVDPDNTYTTTKEEEWVTKKKTELTTTRQIETRVKRQVVLEDGKVVGDSGPIVTTNTTEDTETQEHKQTEHRTTGEDPPGPDWVAIPGPGGLVKEVKERKVKSREEREERIETEDVQHLGDLTDEAYQTAVQNQRDVRQAILTESTEHDESKDVVSSTPKVVHQSSRSHKVVDTEDTEEQCQLQKDGRLVTETRRTTEHEEIRNKEEPDDEKRGHSEEEETRRESSHRFAKTKDQDLVEYIADGVKIGEEMRYVAENVEGERHGDPSDMTDHQEWDSLSTRIRRMRRQGTKSHHTKGIRSPGDPLGVGALPMDRKDALTKKPLDFDQEEETRKVETSKWLEHHFGSDSRSSKDSLDEDDLPSVHPGGSTSYINVTMTSRPINSNRTASTQVVNPVSSTSPNAYTATVNTSSKVFVSSPDTARANGFFQGVTEWSERCNDVKEDRTFTSVTPQRPDRIQVLPSGPNHMFNRSSRTEISSPHTSKNHLDRISSLPVTSHISDRSAPYQSSSQHSINKTAVHESSNFLKMESKAASQYKQNNGRRSPFYQKTSDRSSPYHGYNTSNRPEVTRESPNGYSSMERAPSPYLQGTSSRNEYVFSETKTTTCHDEDDRRHSPQLPHTRCHNVSEDEQHEVDTRQKHSRTESPSVQHAHRTSSQSPSPSPSPSPPLDQPPETRVTPPPSKKVYQRTRFAADIPPPPNRQRSKSPGQSATSIIGESFRKLVDKFRSSSSERKNKRRSKRPSRSPSPHHQHTSSTYQQYHVIDSNIPSVVGPDKSSRVGRRGGGSPTEAERGAEEAEGGESQPVAPPRATRAGRGEAERRERTTKTGQETSTEQVGSMDYHRRGTSPVVQRFYLGEDPFGGSIYGREREYDGVTPVKSSKRQYRQNGHRRGSHPGEEEDMNRTHSSNTLGRLSKSTSRLAGGGSYSPSREPSLSWNTHTLPRKLYDERVKSQTHIQRNGTPNNSHQRESSHMNQINKSHQRHSNSMINVSIVNNVTPPTSSIGISKSLKSGVGISTSTGPAKPARTYRSNLARSKSFNVHVGGSGSTESSPQLLGSKIQDVSNVYKSNPQLHRLNESPPPLKSPGILASISRSQRDLSACASLDKDNDFSRNQETHRFSKSTSNLISNGYVSNSTSTQEAKKKLFLKGLMDRAPELYRTLHGDEDLDIKPLSPSPEKRLHNKTPLKNGISNNISSNRILDYSSSFHSRSANATPENDLMKGGRSLSSPYRPPVMNGTDRVTSPKPSFTSTLTHTPSFRNTNNGTTTSIVRRGSIGSDDYSETVRITSKSDDPIRPSVTNTVQSYSKKTIPTKRGLSTETIESSETKTVTKSRLRGGDSSHHRNPYSMRNGGGGVVIEVRAPRK